jgi:hypothetical protein
MNKIVNNQYRVRRMALEIPALGWPTAETLLQ